jgi:hypothetical protein
VLSTTGTTSPLSYSLVSGNGDSDNQAFVIVNDTLLTNEVFNFESQPNYSIRIRSTDGFNNTVEQAFTISVTAVPEGPVIRLSSPSSVVTGGRLASIDSSATILPQGSGDFTDGELDVTITSGKQDRDQLRLINTGRGADRLHVSKNVLKLGKKTIAIVISGGDTLTVSFIAPTSQALAQRVLQSVGLQASRSAPGIRTIQFQIRDSASQMSAPVSKAVDVVKH